MILLHGGAGAHPITTAQKTCLTHALVLGYETLHENQAAVDVVEVMIRHLEQSGLFNAGRGSRLQLDGVKRMDAALMEGQSMNAGGVANIEKVLHPITAARVVMEHTSHVLIAGIHATRLARHFGLEKDNIISQRKARPQKKAQSFSKPRVTSEAFHYGTVGAVVLDRQGHLAAGSSTGGVPRMQPGRVGDSPLIGCGVYADDTCGGISMTGMGETIMRMALAKHIAMELRKGTHPTVVSRRALQELTARTLGQAGALVLSADGRFAIRHSTPRMHAGYWRGRGKPVVRDRFP